ncbi:MAG: carbohydrate-binding domain-containing protein [Eubacterium sp.]|nr:carbohydrate-binding domain-containing protein [Eubacterium sp.]
MDKKKIIAIAACVVVLGGAGILGFALDKKGDSAKPAEATTVVQPVTDQNGAAVTTPEGATVTEVVSETESTSAESTTESTTAKSTSALVSVSEETTVKTAETTTKKQASKKKTSKKPATTEPQVIYTDIVLKKNGGAECKSPKVSLAANEVIIEEPGNYRITQQTGKDPWHGKIIVRLNGKNNEKAELRFENVNIGYKYSKNIIEIIDTNITNIKRDFIDSESDASADSIKRISKIDKAPNVDLSFPEGTKSTFSSTANSVVGVIYNESKLTIKGHGKAYIKSENVNNCICSTKSITIKNVALYLTTMQTSNTSALAPNTGAAKGIFSYDKVTLESGTLDIKSNGDSIRCDDFFAEGGTATLSSSACDGIDADDAIVINGGTITSKALEKSSFKVRRINNQEKRDSGVPNIAKEDCVRSSSDTFAINGGTVIGESKKITTVQGASKQPSVTCKIVKPSRGTDAAATESKVPAIISIKNLKTSQNKCTKFLYSSSSVVKGKKYTATANEKSAEAKWSGTTAIIDIESVNNR